MLASFFQIFKASSPKFMEVVLLGAMSMYSTVRCYQKHHYFSGVTFFWLCHFPYNFTVLIIYKTNSWFLFAAYRFILSTHQFPLYCQAMAAPYWICSCLRTFGSKNMEARLVFKLCTVFNCTNEDLSLAYKPIFAFSRRPHSLAFKPEKSPLAMKKKAFRFKQGLQIDLTQPLPTSHHLLYIY